jgi:TonB family protein
MFLDFYKIREQPFGETPDPRCLYLSPTHREAIASLAYGINAGRGFLALVAEPGMGKTTVLFHLLEWLRESVRTVFLFQTQCGSHGLLCNLLADLGIDAQGKGLAWMHEQLKEVLINEASVGKRLVVFIDEAQNLSASALETARLLSDFENPHSKLIQIVLVGQPELADKLARPGMAQLRQRVSILARLSPFIRSDTEAYINHRLSVAGSADQELFTPEARTLIADWSRGIPRNINNLCFGALSLGYAMGKHKIDASIVREVINDLDVNPLVTPLNTSPRPCEISAGPTGPGTYVPEVASPEEAATANERDEPSRPGVEPVTSVPIPGRKRALVSLSIALFAFSLVGVSGISLRDVLRQPTVASRVPIPTQTAKQTQNSVTGVKPLKSRSRRQEEKPAVAVPDDKLLAAPMSLSQWESIQGMLVADSNTPTILPTIPEETAVVRVGSDVKEPALTARIAAAYPAEARQSGVEGEVIIDAVVDATGKPTTLRVVSGPALLWPAALESVRKWQYRPGDLGDHPAPMEMRIAVQFRLVS